MKKNAKLKYALLLVLCGIVYMLFAAGSGTEVTTTSVDTGTEAKTSEIAKYKLNEDIYITTNSGKYRIKFTNVSETSDRNQFADTNPKRVVILEYEYENLTKTSDLYVSNMSFNAYDKENNKLDTYPASIKYPSNVGTGRKTTASVAYGLDSDNNYIELDYYDNMFNSQADCRVVIEW